MSGEEDSTQNKPFLRLRKRTVAERNIVLLFIVLVIAVGSLYYLSTQILTASQSISLILATALCLFSLSYLGRKGIYKLLHFTSGVTEDTILDDNALYKITGTRVVGFSGFELVEVPLRLRGKFRYFIRTAFLEKIPLFYIFSHMPVETKSVLKRKLIENSITKSRKKKTIDEKDVETQLAESMEANGGIWKGTVFIGTKAEVLLSPGWRERLQKQLDANVSVLMHSFISAYPHTKIKRVSGKELLELFNSHLLLNSSFYHLTADEVLSFFEIPPMVEKMLKSSYPSEFIVPTYLESDIFIGNAIEPEGVIDNYPTNKVGFTKRQVENGLMVIGADKHQRYLVDRKIITENTHLGYKYVIIDDTGVYRSLLSDFSPSDIGIFRLGKDAGFYLLDPKNQSLEEYAANLLFAFQVSGFLENSNDPNLLLLLQRVMESNESANIMSLVDAISQMLEESIPARSKTELTQLRNALTWMISSDAKAAILLGNIEFNKLLSSKKVLLFETSGSHHFQRFQKIYVLLKLLASEPNTKTIVMIARAEAVFPNMRNINPAIQYLMTQLHKRNVSLHLSIRNPSLLNNVVLSFFKNIVALRILEDKDVQTTANLLMLKESSEGYYSSQRHSLQQISYLKTLPEERAILLRDDVVSAFPVLLDTVPIIEVSDTLIEDVFKVSMPNHSVVTSKSLLEIEFGNDAKFAWSLLNWLNRTPLTMTALTNIFDNVSPEKLFAIVKRMQELNLIKPNVTSVGRSSQIEYILTQRGEYALNTYSSIDNA